MQYVKRVYILYLLINSRKLIDFDYSGVVPVYSGQFGAARAAAKSVQYENHHKEASQRDYRE